MLLKDLAERLDGRVEGDGGIEIRAVAPLDTAGPQDLTFFANPKYAPLLATTEAAAVLVAVDVDVSGPTLVRCADPYAAFVTALGIFDDRPRPAPGVHSTAVVSASATVGEGVNIGAYAVVGDDVVLGADTTVHPHVVIYPEARIGAGSTLHAGSVVRERVVLGDGVTLQPGAVIGADGFGFLPNAGGIPVSIPQVGNVVVGDYVDVGANTTVDRAAAGSTRLEDGVKLDNLVMVAHGCRVGSGSMLAGQVGLAGSTTVGARVMMGGQVGAAGHISIGDDAKVAAQAGLAGSVEAGETVGGSPAVKIGIWRRASILTARLPELFRRLRRVEKALGIDDGKTGGKG